MFSQISKPARQILLQNKNISELLLKIATVCVLAGKSWQHLFWSTSYEHLFYWQNTTYTQMYAYVVGTFLIISAVLILSRKSLSKVVSYLLIAAFVILLIDNLASYVKSGYELALFFEHSAQVTTPLLLYHLVYNRPNHKHFIKIVKLVVAITFACHGIYALGYIYGQPEHFIQMTTSILPIDRHQASSFLVLAGIFDLIVAIGIFIKPLSSYLLTYAFVWGFLTALARIVANLNNNEILYSFHEWGYQVVFRMPHALLPVVIYYSTLAVANNPSRTIKTT